MYSMYLYVMRDPDSRFWGGHVGMVNKYSNDNINVKEQTRHIEHV